MNYSIFLIALSILGLGIGHLEGQTYNPKVYYSFDNPAGPEVSHIYNGCDLTGSAPLGQIWDPNDSLYAIGNQNAIVGSYLNLFSEDQQPTGCPSSVFPNLFVNDFTVEFWYRTGKSFNRGWPFSSDPLLIRFGENSIEFSLRRADNTNTSFVTVLSGIGRNNAGYLYDGQWHHFAARFSSSIGKLKFYVDGQSLPEFQKNFTPGPNRTLTSSFLLTSSSGADAWNGALDEIAIFDEAIPDDLIYQHYLDGVDGDHYRNNIDPSIQTPPQSYSNTTNLNPFDFGPEYPNVPLTSIELIHRYPVPRYTPGDSFPRLLPFYTDDTRNSWSSSFYKSFSGPAQRNINKANSSILKEMARNFNYQLLLGDISNLTGGEYFNVGLYPQLDTSLSNNIAKLEGFMVHIANEPEFENIPRFMSIFWTQVRYGTLTGTNGSKFMDTVGLSSDYYLTDSQGNLIDAFKYYFAPDAATSQSKLDSVARDGLAAYAGVRLMFDSLNVDRIDCIGENGEILSNRWAYGLLAQDSSAYADYQNFITTNGLQNNPDSLALYKTERFTRFRRAYKNGLLDSLLGPGNPDQDSVYHFFYNVSATKGAEFRYPLSRTINDSLMGTRRPTPYWYPNAVNRWEIANNQFIGIRDMINGLDGQWAEGDSLINPAVSPGFNDNNQYYGSDEIFIRPGQYLGDLKILGMLGADTYTYYSYDFSSKGNWKVWPVTTPAYAQSVMLRASEFLYNGRLLEGDSTYYVPGGGTVRFRYNTGTPQEFVSIRKEYGSSRWLINGTLQRLSNKEGSFPSKEKDVCISFNADGLLGSDTLMFSIRPQGSTYILEIDPGDTTFYQLDGWHEWKDPYWWCEDFVLEGELPDNPSPRHFIDSEFPNNGSYAGDLRDATSYIYSSPMLTNMDYHFTPRTEDQDTLYFWVRYRTAGNPGQVAISLDGVSLGTSPTISSTNWTWENTYSTSGTIRFDGLTLETHELSLVPSNSDIQIDKIFLLRSDAVFDTISNAVVAAADTVCINTPTQFFNHSTLAPLCVDYKWDFGDGYVSNEFEPQHTFLERGIYQTILTATMPSTGFSASDTIDVLVIGPEVEAGPDTVLCQGDSLVLNGEAGYVFKWREDSTLSASDTLRPTVWPSQTTIYFLEVTDPGTGCSDYDSVEVLVPELNPVVPDYAVCEDTGALHIEITVQGVNSINWLPDTNQVLDASDPFAAIATVTDSTVFQAVVRDPFLCFIDTLDVPVHVIDSGSVPTAIASQDTICHGDTLQFSASGRTNYQWGVLVGNPLNLQNLWLSAPLAPDPEAWPPQFGSATIPDSLTTRNFVVQGGTCGNFDPDTIPIVVVQPPMINDANLQDTVYYCGSSLPLAANGIDKSPVANYYNWSPGINFSDSTIYNPVLTAAGPTAVTLEVGDHLGCSMTYDFVAMTYISVPETLYTCLGDSIELESFGGDSIWWSPDTLFQFNKKNNAVALVNQSQYLYADIFDLNDNRAILCQRRDSVWIEVRPEIGIQTNDTTLCLNDTIRLNATGANDFIWSPGDILSDSLVSNPLLTVGEDSVIYVTSCDPNACFAFDSVIVNHTCCQANLDTTVTVSRVSALAATQTFNGERLRIRDTLYVDQNISFQNSVFYFDPGAVLMVNDGLSLGVTDCEFRTVCRQQMWDGINMEGSTSELAMYNSLILDAEIGISIPNRARVDVDSCVFRNNWIGISLNGGGLTYNGTVEGTRFVGPTASLLPPHANTPTIAGIYANEVDEWTIGNALATHSNRFDSLGCGIYARRSNLQLLNNDFRFIRQAPGAPGNFAAASGHAVFAEGIQPTQTSIKYALDFGNTIFQNSSFKDCDNGILMDQGYHSDIRFNDFLRIEDHGIRFVECGWTTQLIEDNDFEDVRRAIRGTMVDNADIDIASNVIVNRVQYAGVGIWLQGMAATGVPVNDSIVIEFNDLTTYGTGIITSSIGINANYIENNDITILDIDPANQYAVGISVPGSQGAHIVNNQIDVSTASSVTFQDRAVGIWLNESDNTTLHCNETRNFFEHHRIVGPTITQSIISNDFWDDRTTTAVPQLGILLVDNGNIGQLGNDTVGTGNIWRRDPTSEWICNGADRAMVFTDNTSLSLFETYWVYNSDLQNPDHPNCPNCIGSQNGSGFFIDDGSQFGVEDCESYSPGNDPLIASMNRISEEYLSGESAGTAVGFIQEQQMLARIHMGELNYTENDSIGSAFAGLVSDDQGYIYGRDEDLTEGTTTLESFETEARISENHISIQNHWKSWLNNGSLSSSDSIFLVSFAQKCPQVEGLAVFQARTLLGRLNSQAGPWFTNCSEQTTGKDQGVIHRPTENDQSWVKVFPNPAQSVVQVESEAELARITMFHISGAQVYEEALNADFRKRISVRQLPRGAYVLRIVSTSGKVESTKIILQ